MILREDIFDTFMDEIPQVSDVDITVDEIEPSTPQSLEDSAISTMIIDAIQKTWDLIENYNSIVSTLTELNKYDIIDVVSEIANQENIHIGKLQNALETVSPNASNIEMASVEEEELGESMKIRNTLRESVNNEVEVKAWIGNLGKYNEGELVGEWVTFPVTDEELEDVFNRIGINDEYEETFIGDYDSELPLFDMYGEYPSFDELNELAERLNGVDTKLLLAALEADSNVDSCLDAIDSGSIFLIDVDNDYDLGEYFVNDVDGGVENLDRDTIEKYFDYESLGRDLGMDNYADNYSEEELAERDDDYVTAGEYFCGDENATDTKIGEAYVEMLGGVEFVGSPESYFDYEQYGRDCSFEGTYTEYGFLYGR